MLRLGWLGQKKRGSFVSGVVLMMFSCLMVVYTCTCHAFLNQDVMLSFHAELGAVEDEIFRKRRERDLQFREREREKARRSRIVISLLCLKMLFTLV